MLDIRVGSRVGPYKIVAPLEEAARGGMATLFLAQLARLEGTQLVILKIVPAEDEGSDERRGFRLNALRKEVEILQKLRHPNIVKIYPIPSRNGRKAHYLARATNVPGNPWFCVMEHLGGGSLESRLRELTVLPLGEAAEIAYQIGSALDYMHAKGYVHWDVKPDNILFRYDLSENGIIEAVLTDFGIARGTHEPAVVAGTIHYMSPERWRVHMGEIAPEQIMDQRPADVYALGLVLYEMLAGQLPFVAEDEEGIKSAILEEPPIPLSDFNYEVSPVVEDIIFQALEKHPANRPTMEEMVTLLDRAVPAPRVGILPSSPAAAPAPAPVGAGITSTAAVSRPAARAGPPQVGERRERRPPLLQRWQSWALIAAAAALVFAGGTWAAGQLGLIQRATPEPTVIVATSEPSATPTSTPSPSPTSTSTLTPTAPPTEIPTPNATMTARAVETTVAQAVQSTATAEAAMTATAEAEAAATAEAKERAERAAAEERARATPVPPRLPPKITECSPKNIKNPPVEITIKGQNLSQSTVSLIRTNPPGPEVFASTTVIISDSEIKCTFDPSIIESHQQEWKLKVKGLGGEAEESGFYLGKKPPTPSKPKDK